MRFSIALFVIFWCPSLVWAGGAPVGWVLGDGSESCDTACSNAGGTCSVTNTVAVDDQTKMTFVMNYISETCGSVAGGSFEEDPSRDGTDCYFQSDANEFTCSASTNAERLCCCSNNASDCPTSA